MANTQFVLIVRAPNRNTEDFRVRCTPDWTVRMLKKFLCKEYPTKPDSKRQRLIYSGKLLNDDQTLKDALRQPEGTVPEPQVIHLVCDPSSQQLLMNETTTSSSTCQHASDTGPSPDVVRPSATPSKQGQTGGKDDAATSSSPQSRIGESADTPPLPGWGRGSGGANNFMLFPPFNRLNQHGLAASNTVGREWTEVDGSQPLSLHPWYAAYMTYRAWTLQQRPAEDTNGNHGDRAPPVGEDVQANVHAENDVRENFAMNAGPGMVPPEQNFRQDWLDHFYSVFCFFLLLSIAWSYASVGKFVFFTLILIVILLYQAGFFAIARNRAVRHQNLQEPEELAAPVQEVGRGAPPEERQELGEPQEEGEGVGGSEDAAEPEEGLAHGVEEGTDGGEPDPEEATPEVRVGRVEVEEQPGVFKTLLIFVVSFFTSLVPQRPPEFVGN